MPVDWQLLLTSGSVFFVLESRINAITAPRNANMILELSPSTSLVSIVSGSLRRVPDSRGINKHIFIYIMSHGDDTF